MPDQAKNLLIGIFVVAASAIVIFLMMFLHPSTGDQGRLLRVRFANIDKISVGTRVTFAGKPVGEVIEIRELADVENERKAIYGFVYVYELTLRVDSRVNVFNTDEIAARTSGLLGEKSVVITPEVPKPGETLHLVNDEVIYATETGSVEDTLKDLKVLADKVDDNLDGIRSALDTLEKEKFWENIGHAMSNINDITKALNNPGQWSETLANFHSISVNVDKVTNDLDQSWPKIDKAIEDFSLFAENSRKGTDKFGKGEGTFGKLFNNDEVYLRTASLLSKAETTLNDINHYGLLFQQDKGWQRLRARRLNLMQKLQTPQEFRNYFNDEVDTINTSLSRVSMIMEQVEQQDPCGFSLIQNTEFTKVYAELLRRVTELEEEIRLYNQQVVDTAVKETEFVEYCDY